MYDYITIERKYGSGGHGIAEKLAKKLNYRLYDRGVVVETCKRMGLSYDQVSGMDEQTPIKAFFRAPGENLSMEEKIFNTEVEIIREAAEQPGCVFVGRCASEILKDKKCLKVFITADDQYRRDRAVTVEGIEKDKADEVMRKFDKKREKFFQLHSGEKWGSSEYFDLIINSGQMEDDDVVALLEALAKA
ncbi:Cytidylate kinase [Pseudobutyrivibrio sp. YE44]|uniref:cytidylate kinase-like family protein n=1 Tax=Pseudobutyrivibrio sp. YE44 TaxID=1520802 RepID=UPI000890654D|nr:cytidylate kinase-like family protein [Pseudobutyrivibrio sp. YE44]SDB20981.1 Cytidylate kinase [Pseudobutyrivibrio sp. YE44]